MERGRLEDLCLDGRIMLKLIFKKRDEEAGLPWLRIGTGGGHV